MRQRFFSRPLLILLCVVCVFNSAAAGEPGSTNWAQFRGPGNRGVADGANLPERWSATENVAWKTEIPGRGWSSPIVWGDRVFVTTVVNEGQTEKP